MLGMHRTMTEFTPGTRLVSGTTLIKGLDGIRRSAALRIETVESIDAEAVAAGWNARMTLRCGFWTRDVILCQTSIVEEGPWKVAWTDPLPADDAEALALVAGAHMTGDGRRAVLLWVAQISDGVAYCHQLTDDGNSDDRLLSGEGMRWDASAIVVESTQLEPNMVVAALHAGAVVRDGRIVHHIIHPAPIMRDTTLARAITIPSPNLCGYALGNFEGTHRLREAEDRAHASTQRSEALVLRQHGGKPHALTAILASTGTAFHMQDDAVELLADAPPGDGLWMIADAVFTAWADHEGEWDARIDGTWRPAEQTDLAAMLGSPAAVQDAIADATDGEPEDAAQTPEARMAMARYNAAVSMNRTGDET